MNLIKEQPIFIVGSERSGTTMLRLILNEHQNIALPPQTKFTRKILKRKSIFGNLEKLKNRQKMTDWMIEKSRNTKLIDLGLDINDLRRQLDRQTTLGGVFRSVFYSYAKQRNKNRWGDKRPYYIRFIPELLECFPDAKIIHIIRDGRDCVASLKRMTWWKKHPVYSMLNWRFAIRKGYQARKRFPHQYYEIKYEDLVLSPEKSIRKLCSFIGEDFNPNMLEFYQHSQDNVPAYKKEWHVQTSTPVNTNAIGKWKKNLSITEVQVMEWCTQRELIRLSYLKEKPRIPCRQLHKYLIIWFLFQIEIFRDSLIRLINKIFYTGQMSYFTEQR